MMRGSRGLSFLVLAAVAACAMAAPRASAEESGGAVADSSSTAPRPITLREAVGLAQRGSPSAVQARGQERTAAAGNRSAVAAFLPDVTLSAGATRQYGAGTRVEDGKEVTLASKPWSYSGSLGASVQLFDGGARYFELRRARAAASAAGAGTISQLYAVALEVKQRYFDVLAARESEVAARAQLAQAELQRRTAVARVMARAATRSDSLRSEIQLRDAQLAVLEAGLALESSNAGLGRAVGVAYPVTAAPDDPAASPTLAVDGQELRKLAEVGPAVRQAKAELDAARASRRGAWTDYLPSVSASYSRGASGSGYALGLDAADGYDYSGSLRLSLSLPLFNQLQREAQVVRAQVAEANAEAALRDARLAALESLTTALGAYRTAGQRIEAQAASVEAAEEDLRVQQQRYAVGSSTMLDVLTSQTTLDQARQQLIRARYDQRVAKARLEALVGRDL